MIDVINESTVYYRTISYVFMSRLFYWICKNILNVAIHGILLTANGSYKNLETLYSQLTTCTKKMYKFGVFDKSKNIN